MALEKSLGPGMHLVVICHINDIEIMGVAVRLPQFLEIAFGSSAAKDGMSHRDELFRHRQPEAASHAGNQYTLCRVHGESTNITQSRKRCLSKLFLIIVRLTNREFVRLTLHRRRAFDHEASRVDNDGFGGGDLAQIG